MKLKTRYYPIKQPQTQISRDHLQVPHKTNIRNIAFPTFMFISTHSERYFNATYQSITVTWSNIAIFKKTDGL